MWLQRRTNESRDAVARDDRSGRAGARVPGRRSASGSGDRARRGLPSERCVQRPPRAGDGNFSESADSPVLEATRLSKPMIVDIDESGDNDVLATSSFSGAVEVWLGDGTGDLTPFPAGSAPLPHGVKGIRSYLVVDLDRDLHLDAVLGHELSCCPGSNSTVLLFEGAGDGTFDPAATITTRSSDNDADDAPLLAVGDLNGDLNPDIVASDLATHILLGNGALVLNRAPGGTLKYYNSTPWSWISISIRTRRRTWWSPATRARSRC